MMGAPTAEAGTTGKPTATACAPDPRARVSIRARGITVSRQWAFTPGPAGTRTRATGNRGNATGSVWRPGGGGPTEESGVTE